MFWNGDNIVNISREFLSSNGASKHVTVKAAAPKGYDRKTEGTFTDAYIRLRRPEHLLQERTFRKVRPPPSERVRCSCLRRQVPEDPYPGHGQQGICGKRRYRHMQPGWPGVTTRISRKRAFVPRRLSGRWNRYPSSSPPELPLKMCTCLPGIF